MAKPANSFGKITTKISALQAKADKLSSDIKALTAFVAAEGKKAAAAAPKAPAKKASAKKPAAKKPVAAKKAAAPKKPVAPKIVK